MRKLRANPVSYLVSSQGDLPQNRRGVAATELALLTPFILLLVVGAVDFGRFAHSYIAVTNAARAGAGYAAMHPTTNRTLSTWQAGVRQAVLDELEQTLTANGLVASDVTTTIPAPTVESGSGSGTRWRASVTVTMPFHSITAWPALPHNVTLSRTSVQRGIR